VRRASPKRDVQHQIARGAARTLATSRFMDEEPHLLIARPVKADELCELAHAPVGCCDRIPLVVEVAHSRDETTIEPWRLGSHS